MPLSVADKSKRYRDAHPERIRAAKALGMYETRRAGMDAYLIKHGSV
jgi:hypothetical protein